MTTGESIVLGFRELRKFCNQLSLLLRTADGLMGEAGWIPIPRSTVVGSGSGGIEFPDWWLPADFSRFYRHDSQRHLLTYVAAIVNDHPNDPGGVVVTKSLISSGWFDYGVGNESKPWEYKFCRAHIWWDDQLDYGTLRVSDNPQLIGLPAYILKSGSLACLIDDVLSPAALKEKVIQPLLDDISHRITGVVAE